MNEQLENKIINAVKTNIDKYGVYSIRQAAEVSFYPDLKLSDQKRLAKKLVKEFPCITEIKNGEVLVRKNEHYVGPHADTIKEFDWINALLSVLAAGLGFVLFKILLPNL